MKPTRFKFRAWDTDDLSMRYDIGVTPDGYADAPWGKEKYDCPLMQWTGLYDKNGKEVFEGDILEFDRYEWYRSPLRTREEIEAKPPHLFAVKWKDHEWLFDGCAGDIPRYCEIKGNIYQHPHLLEAQ